MIKRAAQGAVVVGVVLAAWLVHKTGALERVLTTIDSAGIWGPLIFLAAYAFACVLFVPSSVFAFSGGVLFGFGTGSALSVFGNGLGSLTAFWIGRYLARRWVEKFLAARDSFKRLAAALEQKGWKIVLLARLSPVFPFSICNYAFGTTRIPAWKYAVASVTGTIPSAMVYAYLGVVTGDLSLLRSGARPRMAWEWALLALGLIATVVLFFCVRNITRKALE